MAKLIAAFFADSHLQSGAWASRPIIGDSYWYLQQIVDFTIAKNIPHLFGAGDLLDKQLNRAEPIVMFSRQIDKLEEARVGLYYLQGQHELEDAHPWLASHRWPIHLHNLTIDVGGLGVRGLDYQSAESLKVALDAVPKGIDILAMHQVWGDIMGSVAVPQGSFGDIPVVNTVVTGDYHVAKTFQSRGRDGQKLTVYSPGSTCLQSIDEPAEKSFLVLSDDGKFATVHLHTRPVIDWEPMRHTGHVDFFAGHINEQLDLAIAMAVNCPDHIRKPLLRVTYAADLIDVRRRVGQIVGDKAHVFYKELVPEKPAAVQRLAAAREAGQRRGTTLDSLLSEYLTANGRSYLEAPCRRLLNAASVEDELRRLREEALAASPATEPAAVAS